MKVSASMEFDIFQLFCHDWPYGLTIKEGELSHRLNKELQNMYLTDYRIVDLLDMRDCGLDRWLIRIVTWKDKNDDDENTIYPKKRVYTVAEAKKAIPAPIRRVLEKLNKRSFIFKQEGN